MSKGSPRRTLRVPEKLCEQIEAAIDSANVRRFQAPYDWSGWALQAIREKLRSLERGRASSKRKSARKKKQPAAQGEPITVVMGAAHAPPSLI
jgi:hypothetical protein